MSGRPSHERRFGVKKSFSAFGAAPDSFATQAQVQVGAQHVCTSSAPNAHVAKSFELHLLYRSAAHVSAPTFEHQHAWCIIGAHKSISKHAHFSNCSLTRSHETASHESRRSVGRSYRKLGTAVGCLRDGRRGWEGRPSAERDGAGYLRLHAVCGGWTLRVRTHAGDPVHEGV